MKLKRWAYNRKVRKEAIQNETLKIENEQKLKFEEVNNKNKQLENEIAELRNQLARNNRIQNTTKINLMNQQRSNSLPNNQKQKINNILKDINNI